MRAGLGGSVGGLDEHLLGGLVEMDEDVDEFGRVGQIRWFGLANLRMAWHFSLLILGTPRKMRGKRPAGIEPATTGLGTGRSDR